MFVLQAIKLSLKLSDLSNRYGAKINAGNVYKFLDKCPRTYKLNGTDHNQKSFKLTLIYPCKTFCKFEYYPPWQRKFFSYEYWMFS